MTQRTDLSDPTELETTNGNHTLCRRGLSHYSDSIALRSRIAYQMHGAATWRGGRGEEEEKEDEEEEKEEKEKERMERREVLYLYISVISALYLYISVQLYPKGTKSFCTFSLL